MYELSLEIKTLLESIPDCKIEGISHHSSIIGISSLKNAKDGDLSFLANSNISQMSKSQMQAL